MSSRIREALTDLEKDVAGLRLAPAAAVRARGDARRRRQVAGAVAAVAVGAAVTGAVALPPLYGGGPHGGLAAGGPASASSARSPAPGHCPSGPSHPAGRGTSPSTPAAVVRTVRVFMSTSSTPAQRAAVASALDSLPEIVGYTYEDHERAYLRFKAVFCDAPDLVGATKPESLPESFVVTLRSPAAYSIVDSAVGHLPGVDAVVGAAN